MLDLRQAEQAILVNCRVNPLLLADTGGKITETDGRADPAESAKAAGLRYVSDAIPGIARIRTGKGFFSSTRTASESVK